MARKLRIEYPGAIYHGMSRGGRQEPIFRDDEDRQKFIATLGEACAKTGWQVHALWLMRNHFHLVLETPEGNLVAGMKWFLGTYTGRFNREALKRRRWTEKDLSRRPKGDLVKVKLAARLREQTTMTVAWIAERLQMGTAGYVNNRL
jgi:REP element-mobilizing transposase RayT